MFNPVRRIVNVLIDQDAIIGSFSFSQPLVDYLLLRILLVLRLHWGHAFSILFKIWEFVSQLVIIIRVLNFKNYMLNLRLSRIGRCHWLRSSFRDAHFLRGHRFVVSAIEPGLQRHVLEIKIIIIRLRRIILVCCNS
jgi:hypothetical protein